MPTSHAWSSPCVTSPRPMSNLSTCPGWRGGRLRGAREWPQRVQQDGCCTGEGKSISMVRRVESERKQCIGGEHHRWPQDGFQDDNWGHFQSRRRKGCWLKLCDGRSCGSWRWQGRTEWKGLSSLLCLLKMQIDQSPWTLEADVTSFPWGRARRFDITVDQCDETAFRIGNGASVSDIAGIINLGTFKGTIQAHILEDAPSVLSLGKRCVEAGFTFTRPK